MGIKMGELRDCSMCATAIVNNINSSNGIACGSNNMEHQHNFMQGGYKCAGNCSGFTDINESKGTLIKNDVALRFLLAGKCEFTVVSGRTGVKIGYKLTKKKSNRDEGSEFIYYLNTLLNGELVYCGVLFFDEKANGFRFAKGASGNVEAGHINVQSILFILNNFHKENTQLNLRIYHVGKCGRCGRKLTTPESILTGLGPECSRLCGVPRVKVAKKDFI